MRRSAIATTTVALLQWLCIALLIVSCSNGSYRTASRQSAGIAPDPAQTPEAVIQVYGADVWGWRAWFAIHTWIAAKRSHEDSYQVFDVVGWRGRYGHPVLQVARDIPDRYWYGAKPKLIQQLRGQGVDRIIDDVEKAVAAYPWAKTYKAFPGPNSNTFTAWVGELVPALDLSLPFSAIGSGYVDQAPEQISETQQAS